RVVTGDHRPIARSFQAQHDTALCSPGRRSDEGGCRQDWQRDPQCGKWRPQGHAIASGAVMPRRKRKPLTGILAVPTKGHGREAALVMMSKLEAMFDHYGVARSTRQPDKWFRLAFELARERFPQFAPPSWKRDVDKECARIVGDISLLVN